MDKQQIIDYYSRKEICEEIFNGAAGREIAGAFSNGSYDSRPNVIEFPSDVIQMAQKGITSFHYSVEHWKNPMAIKSGNYDSLRSGWDLIIDIDSKIGIKGAQIAAVKICEFFEKYGIKNYGIKFSGSRGFHLCLPSKMFPKKIDYKPIELFYPEMPRILTDFIREKISEDLMKELKLNKPFSFVEIEKGWGNRHMFRAPYSFNEKTWMVSVPINLNKLKNFDESLAKHENVSVSDEFFKGEENEAESFLLDAWDFYALRKKESVKKKIIQNERKIREEFFPPCMKIILSGLKDGRKRATYALIHFLHLMNWNSQEIEKKVMNWNSKNKPPLPENFIFGQLRWAENNIRSTKCPPQGDIYTSIEVCKPDKICKNSTNEIQIKNPMSYPFKKMNKMGLLEKSYNCSKCEENFPTVKNLQRHLSKTHGEM